MGFADSMREAMYKYIPGLGKAPEISSAKAPEKKAESRERKEVNTVESASVVIAKRKFDQHGNPKEAEMSEDTAIVDEELGLFAVADGVGSAGHGEVASQIARDVVTEVIRAGKREGMTDADREALMFTAMEKSGTSIAELAKTDTAYAGMDTTFAGFLLDHNSDGSMVATIGSVGDSRVFKYNAAKGLVSLTADDSALELLKRLEIIPEKSAHLIDQSSDNGKNIDLPFATSEDLLDKVEDALIKLTVVSKESAKLDPAQRKSDRARLQVLKRHLETQIENKAKSGQGKTAGKELPMSEQIFKMRNRIFDALSAKGATGHHLNVKTVDVEPGDLLFAVSDGLTDPLTDEQITQTIEDGLAAGKEVGEIFRDLAELAVADISPRQKGEMKMTARDGSVKTVFQGDDTCVSGARVSFQEGKERRVSPEQPQVGEKVFEPEPTVELAYEETQVDKMRNLLKTYQKTLSNLQFAEGAKAPLEEKRKFFGENVSAPELSVPNLITASASQLKEIERNLADHPELQKYSFDDLVGGAKSTAEVVMKEQGLKTMDQVADYLRKETGKLMGKIANIDAGIKEFEQVRDHLRPGAEVAKINLLRALAERPERVEEGDEVTIEMLGQPTKVRVNKGKGKDIILEPVDNSRGARLVMPLDGPRGPANLAKLKEAFAKEAEAIEDELVARQKETAMEMAGK